MSYMFDHIQLVYCILVLRVLVVFYQLPVYYLQLDMVLALLKLLNGMFYRCIICNQMTLSQ